MKLKKLRFDESVVGGETLFVDGFQIAEKFRQEHPKLFDALTRIPASFQKTHDYMGRKIFIQHSKPHIVVNQRQKVKICCHDLVVNTCSNSFR